MECQNNKYKTRNDERKEEKRGYEGKGKKKEGSERICLKKRNEGRNGCEERKEGIQQRRRE